MKTQKIVCTGGPSVGKTSVINHLLEQGFICFLEIIRTLTDALSPEEKSSHSQSNPIVMANNSMQFNNSILEGRLMHYNEATALKETVAFFDRGMPDVLAYMQFFDQSIPQAFTEVCKENKYDQVFVFPPWAEIYKKDAQRFESFEEAVAIHHALVKTYTSLGYVPITVPKDTIANRANFIVKQLNS